MNVVGSTAFDFTCLLHTYFRVADVTASTVSNLRGCTFIDKVIFCQLLSRRSTTTNLLEKLDDWTLALNDKASVATIYIDYSKAFDVVCHSKL